jgi:hypothetical protein
LQNTWRENSLECFIVKPLWEVALDTQRVFVFVFFHFWGARVGKYKGNIRSQYSFLLGKNSKILK